MGVQVFDSNSEFFQEERPNCLMDPPSPGEDLDWGGTEFGPDDFEDFEQSELAGRSGTAEELEEDALQHEGDELIDCEQESDEELDLSALHL